MSRCYYLEYVSNGFFSSANDKYVCKLCGKEYHKDDPQVKYTCKAEYGDEYEKCQVYKERR